jgi:hypothetical protein
MDLTWVLVLVPFISAGGGAFLGSYLKKKAENLATHEDLGKILVEVRATTQATKEIEAKISDATWDRQKRWELKREVLFKTADKITTAKAALIALSAHYTGEREEHHPPYLRNERARVGCEWSEAEEGLNWATLLVGLACGEELERSLLLFVQFTSHLAGAISNEQPEALNELDARMNALLDAMRQELKL